MGLKKKKRRLGSVQTAALHYSSKHMLPDEKCTPCVSSLITPVLLAF